MHWNKHTFGEVDVEAGCLAQKVELRFQADDISEFSIEDDQCGISILSYQVR